MQGKTILYTCVACINLQTTQAQSFTLKGTLPKTTLAINRYVYLSYRQHNQTITDSCRLEKHTYHFQGKIDYPAEATLYLKVSEDKAQYYFKTHFIKPYQHVFFLDKGGLTAVSANELNDTRVSGSVAEDDHLTMEKEQHDIYQEGEKNFGEERKAAFARKDSAAIAAVLRKAYAVDDAREAAKLRFMQQHPQTGIMLKLLNEYTRTKIDPVVIGPLYDGMQPALKASPEGIAYGARLAKARETAPGMPAPQVTLPDRNGNTITLASLKGKVVLLDFWGSWCYPCRMSHPHLRETYARYHDAGFEILGIANERGEESEWKEKWTKALDEDHMTWLNVLNTSSSTEKEKGILNAYDVKAFPTKILIDREGKIVEKLVGNSEKNRAALDALLEKLLGQH